MANNYDLLLNMRAENRVSSLKNDGIKDIYPSQNFVSHWSVINGGMILCFVFLLNSI